MIYEPADEWEEAGTTVFYSRWSFIAIIVRKNKEGKKEIVARWTDADDKKAIKVHYLRLEAELITDQVGESRATRKRSVGTH
jgi:hypothetical protein